MDEAKKRDYKDEYKKFQSSTKAKKYRAELNKYNRKKGTYEMVTARTPHTREER